MIFYVLIVAAVLGLATGVVVLARGSKVSRVYGRSVLTSSQPTSSKYSVEATPDQNITDLKQSVSSAAAHLALCDKNVRRTWYRLVLDFKRYEGKYFRLINFKNISVDHTGYPSNVEVTELVGQVTILGSENYLIICLKTVTGQTLSLSFSDNIDIELFVDLVVQSAENQPELVAELRLYNQSKQDQLLATKTLDQSRAALVAAIRAYEGKLITVGPVLERVSVGRNKSIDTKRQKITGWLNSVQSIDTDLSFGIKIIDIDTATERDVTTDSSTVFMTVTKASLRSEIGAQTSV